MKLSHTFWQRYLHILLFSLLGGVLLGSTPMFAQTGSVTSEAVPSNSDPLVGEQIDVAINIDMTNVDPPDNKLGSYTGSLTWDPAVLKFVSWSGGSTTGWDSPTVNDADSATGIIRFSDANPTGTTGAINIINIRLKAFAPGTSVLDLAYSAMSSASTFKNLLTILTVNDGSVTVHAPGITVTSPNGGENWTVGTSQNITWTSIGTSGNVKIEYSADNGTSWTEVVASTTDDGSYSWTVPNTPTTTALVRVTDVDGSPSDVSDAVFTISAVPAITVTSPNGGETWQVGSVHDITWTSVNTSGNVKIEYSADNGTSWTEIIASTADDGSYSWTVPNTPTTTALVRVTDVDGSPSDQSDAVFTISAATGYTLTMAVNPANGGTTVPPVGDHVYAPDTVVPISAIAKPNFRFLHWTGDVGNIAAANTTVKMDSNKTVTANFFMKLRPFATPTMGCPELVVHFEDNSEGTVTAWQWDFGDGNTSTERNPTHVYSMPGRYDVTLTITTPDGPLTSENPDMISVCGYGPTPCAALELVDNSSASPGEAWDNAIDHDISGWDGTVTAQGNPPYGVFQFADGKTKSINKVRLLTDTGVEMENRWVRRFHVMVSTTGISDANFTTVLTGSKNGGDWQEYTFSPVLAKYVKLVLDDPASGWRQIGEFQVCPIRTFADPGRSTVAATSPHIANGVDLSQITLTVKDAAGNPLTGLSEEDFSIYAVPGPNIYYPVTATSTPGVYQAQMASLAAGAKLLRAIVNGVTIGTATINFTQPTLQKAALVLVKDTETFRGEGWDNAIDGDQNGYDGTVTAGGSQPYAIFGFADGSIKAVQQFNLLVDTGVGNENRWVRRFRLLASTSGQKDADFVTIYDGLQRQPGWQTHLFPAANAKYVKLVIDFPASGWRQLGEIEIMTSTALTVANNSPMAENLISVLGSPTEFSVSNNYPNPFNPTTSLDFALPEKSDVEITVFNMLGQKVRTLLDVSLNVGYYTITWDGKDDLAQPLPSGTYIIHIQAADHNSIRKVLMLK